MRPIPFLSACSASTPSSRFERIAAQIPHRAIPAFRFPRLADVTPVQDQPVMGVALEFVGHHLFQHLLDHFDVFPRRKAGAVRDPENMRIDGNRFLPERDIENDIGCFPPDAGQRHKRVAVLRHFAAEPLDQHPAQGDHVLCLGVEQADGPDVVFEAVLAQRQHFFRRAGDSEQRFRRLVHAFVGRLRRQDHGDQQGEGIGVMQFPLRLRVGGAQAGEEFVDVIFFHKNIAIQENSIITDTVKLGRLTGGNDGPYESF